MAQTHSKVLITPVITELRVRVNPVDASRDGISYCLQRSRKIGLKLGATKRNSPAGFALRVRDVINRYSPSMYKALVRARHARALQLPVILPERIKLHRVIARGLPLTVDVSGRMGLGGMLNHARAALQLGRENRVNVALRFTAPLYRPSSGETDWLDCYFNRLGRYPEGCNTFDSRVLSRAELFDSDYAHLVWEYLEIRPELKAQADAFVGDARYAAVHYRGSDKFLEERRISSQLVLERLEREMRSATLDRVFIASDEPSFIEAAERRFGHDAFWLPCEAMAKDGRPPHFRDLAGELKAREALVTMILLSKAKLCVRSPSFFSAWAATLASHQRVVLV